MRKVCLFCASLFTMALLFPACQTVKPYQRIYLKDAQMELQQQPILHFETLAEGYREGASGAIGTSAGGGCGCN